MADRSTAKRPAATKATADGFTEEEKAAVKERARELKAASRRGAAKVDVEAEVVAKIAEMSKRDRDLAERLHALVKATVPELVPRLWYGMPAYAKDGKVVCFFQPADKFKSRYATLGFSDDARIDDGTMWATAFGLTEMTEANETRIGELLRRAVG